MVNEIIGVALLGIIFSIAIATVVIALIDRRKKPEPLLGVVRPKTPQDAVRSAKTNQKDK